MWSFEMVAAMLAVGAVAGVIAGMFGVGGGTILVPLVLWIVRKTFNTPSISPSARRSP